MDTVGTGTASLQLYLPDSHWLLLPLVPLAAVAVAVTPVVAGIMVVALPMVVPVLVVLAMITTIGIAIALLLYASTRQGRQQWIRPVFGPFFSTIVMTQLGQQCMYQTGPRPTPVQLCRFLVPSTSSAVSQLFVSLWLDFMGSASYLLPLVGEVTDVVWAPIQTTLLMAMYPEGPSFLKYLSMTEELLPLTDIIPTATLGWFHQHGIPWLVTTIMGKDPSAFLDDDEEDRPPLHMVTTTTKTTPSTPFSTPRH
jgi:hypothetical protein